MWLHVLAGALRRRPTLAERRMWHCLRSLRAAGIRFRRQRPIGPYIVDFVCLERRIVVEVDGGQHLNSREDLLRDAWLQDHGHVVLRFWNNEVLQQTDAVMERIVQAVSEVPPVIIRPPPSKIGL
jgi:very-short-patch-repair endonuclease